MRSNFFLFITFWVAFLLSGAAHAEQVFYVDNNETIIGIASTQEITRLSIAGDRIISLNYVDGEFSYNIQQNDLYLRANIHNKPINFFVSTESGRSYKFILEVKDIPATQIFVHPKRVANKTFKRQASKKVSSFQSNISKIIKVLESEEKHLGFVLRPYKYRFKRDGLNQQGVMQANGKGLIGEKLSLQNYSTKVLKIKNQEFMTPGVIGVYLSKDVLTPGEKTTLIRISREQ